MKIYLLVKRLFSRGARKRRFWETLSDSERQAIAKSRKDNQLLTDKEVSSRVNLGPMLPGEGSYTNSADRDQFVGAGDSALARSLAEERARAIKNAKRKR
jgi:hypothetical protein